MIQFHELPNCARYYREPALENAVGFIPMMLSESDPRPAREQLHQGYAHGGGWRPFEGFTLHAIGPAAAPDGRIIPSIKYPGDPTFPPLAYATLREEVIVVYPYAWVLILQPDDSYEISRMD